MIPVTALAAGLALALDMPAVLAPLGLSVKPAEPPTIRVSIQFSGNDRRKQELALAQAASRRGGAVLPAEGKPEGPKYVQVVFPPSALGHALDSAPETGRLIDARPASLTIFDPQREPRRAVLLVRLALEASPAEEILMTPPGKKP